MKTVLVLGASGAMGRYVVPELARMGHAVDETYTLATTEHHAWGDIAELYASLRGLRVVWAPEEEFMRIRCPDPWDLGLTWQLRTDRLFERIVDNSKILAATGLSQGDLMPLAKGLETELAKVPRGYEWQGYEGEGRRMDEWLEARQ